MWSLFIAAALAVSVQAQNLPSGWKGEGVNKWGGLNLLQDSTAIDGDCQDCKNVLTDNTFLEKRPGSTLLATISSGTPVSYVNEWVSPAGTRYLIAQAGSTIYQTNFSGSPVFLSTIASGFTLTTTAAFSKLHFADGATPLWYWDGNSTATIPGAPICTYTAFKDNRLFCANIPNASSSQVDISSAGGNGYWVVPPNASLVDNAPNQFLFTPDDGDYITCMAATPFGVFVGKRYSSYMIKGNGNLTYNARLLDPKIGCVDNRTVQMVYGVLVWLALDGVYGYDGSGPPRLISRELDPLMKTVRAGIYSDGQWATQLASDWRTGITSPGTNNLPLNSWDFFSVPGEVFPSSFTLYDDNSNHATEGKLGFNDDSLINIDTTTAPTSLGYAQIKPSTDGVRVWFSSFPAGNFTTTPTTWTTYGAGSVQQFTPVGNAVRGSGAGLNNTFFTMAASQGPPPGPNGWTFGVWSVQWVPEATVTGSGNHFYGIYNTNGQNGTEVFRYDFIADQKSHTNPIPLWNGYGYVITGIDNCPGNFCTYRVDLYRNTSSFGQFNIGSGNISFSVSPANTFMGFSTVTVTKTEGGDFAVYFGTTQIITAHDSTPAANVARVSNIYLPQSSAVDGNQGDSILGYADLKGYVSGQILSRIFDTGMTVPFAGALSSTYTLTADSATSISFYVRDSTSPNNDMWSAWMASSNGVVAVLPERYWQYQALFNTTVASSTPKLYSVELKAITTGYYYSKVDFIGPQITSWKQFAITEDHPGTYGYAIRTASYAFSQSDTSIPWVPQQANQNITASTGAYAQFRLDSTVLISADQAEPVSAVFLRWANGTYIPLASETLDRRYYLCVTISTTATAPDTCLIRQKNNKWVFFQIASNTISAMGMFNYNIVAAEGDNSSKVLEIMQPGVYNDDGLPINAYWISSDFIGNALFNNEVLHEIWVDASPVAQSSVTVSYAMDKNKTWVDYQFSVDNGEAPDASNYPTVNPQSGDINKYIPLSAGTEVGKFIRLKISDAQLNDYFRINAYLLYTEDMGRSIP